MCGIAGFQGAFPRALLDAMNGCLAHRGPDGAGMVAFGAPGTPQGVGLAHRRLAILDLSDEGLQPMGTTCGACGTHTAHGDGMHDGLALVFNGEIYNFRELRASLVAAGHVFRSKTDTEVLLHLWSARGHAMLHELNGIFAFALYDGRARGRPAGVEQGDVFLARDALGVKPLYLAETPAGVTFASELKALLPTPGLSRTLDLHALHETLAFLWTPAPRTMLRDVRKLEPGHALVLRDGGVARRWEWYRPPLTIPPADSAMLDEAPDAVAAQVRRAVFEAVERQLVADVPVGAFLSGGLDSSAVVAGMRHASSGSGTRPVAYTIGFGEGEDIDGAAPDLPYARRVARHLDVELRELQVAPTMVDELERLLWLLDEPQADPAPINALLISEQARRDGVPVLLSGAGGDDIFSGYRRHRALGAERLWQWAPGPLRGAAARLARGAAVGRGALGGGAPLVRRAVKAFSYADLPSDDRLVSYFWWSPDSLRRPLYAPEVAHALRDADAAVPLRASLHAMPPSREPLDRMLHLEMRHFLADHNLNYTDKTGMAAGVEVRVPLLDLELVALAARIPPALKQRGAEGKWIFKRAMEPDLPRDVIYRPKTGFGAPLRRWLRQELRGHVEELLSPDVLRARGLFDPAGVAHLVALDRAGAVDGSYTIFAMMCMELWCRLFVDGSPASATPTNPRRA